MNFRSSLILALVLGAFTFSLHAQEAAATSAGIDLFNKGDYAGVVAALKDSKNYIELSYLGLAYEKLGKEKKAGDAFDESMMTGYNLIMDSYRAKEDSDKKDTPKVSSSEKLKKLAGPISVTLAATYKIRALKTKLGKSDEVQMIGDFLAALDRLLKGGETVYSDDELTTSLKITSKPHPTYTDEARRNWVEGKVQLLALFGADGKISAAPLITLKNGLTLSSYLAALRMKFEPATKDGKPVAVLRRVEYVFDVY